MERFKLDNPNSFIRCNMCVSFYSVLNLLTIHLIGQRPLFHRDLMSLECMNEPRLRPDRDAFMWHAGILLSPKMVSSMVDEPCRYTIWTFIFQVYDGCRKHSSSLIE